MPATTRNQQKTSAKKSDKPPSAKGGKKDRKAPPKKAPAKRSAEYSSDCSDYSEDSKDVLMQRLEALQKENTQLRSAGKPNKKARIPGPTAYIPSSFDKEVTELARTEVWRKTKFVSNDDESLQLAHFFITNMPEFKFLVVDDQESMHQNVVAFDQIYGKIITKALNNKRTNVQGTMRKSYLKRAAKGLFMPTPQELLQAVKRQGMLGLKPVPKLIEMPEEPEAPKDGNEDSEEYQAKVAEFNKLKTEIAAKNQEIVPKIAEAEAHNAPILRTREVFRWYWNELLPDVVGKHNWGHNIRRWNTITEGRFPGKSDKKYITSSDEALCVTLYENCAQRFVYAAECQKNGVEEDRNSDAWQSKWSDIKAGQNNFGGFHPDGRARYAKLQKHIAKAKKQPHVKALEKEILASIQYGEGMEEEEEVLEPRKEPPKVVCVAMLDSDDEDDSAENGGEESELEEFVAVFQKPKPKKRRK